MEAELDSSEIKRILNRFLKNQTQESRALFLRRYWYGESIRELAMTNGSDGQPVYYELGELTLPLSEDCTFEDQADLTGETQGTVYEYPDVPAAIQNSAQSFQPYDTVIMVRMEEIVQIIRYQMP